MDLQWKILAIVIAAIAIKYCYNFIRLRETEKLYSIYKQFLFGQCHTDFHPYIDEAQDILKEAGVTDGYIKMEELVGIDTIKKSPLYPLLNATTMDSDVNLYVQSMFERAIGVYRRRRRDAFSAVYWYGYVPNLFLRVLRVIHPSIDSKIKKGVWLSIIATLTAHKMNLLEWITK
jgi:hypothetical protein